MLFEPLPNPLNNTQIERLEKLTSQAFSARRKMIRQSLKTYNNLENACNQLKIPLTSRPEELTPQQFFNLSQTL